MFWKTVNKKLFFPCRIEFLNSSGSFIFLEIAILVEDEYPTSVFRMYRFLQKIDNEWTNIPEN